MARTNAVWGIDIGQCALKALRCRAHDDGDKVIAEAFDYIEYPKILTQPDADPAELIAEALKLFLSRNSVRGDRIAVSVSGQSGLARFIKLPPVEAKKIPDIVRYEARQQIPFDLNDVIWDYQRMGGGAEEQGFVLETEIGLFAMKRDAVFRALEPFQKANIEVDFVQLSPLALYNYVVFDQLQGLPPPEEYDPENPPESVVVISLGTDATDLVVTNGFRVWQRSVPLGGSHFTKALTKELKLTFAKAEHLKRNATTAQDPKAVFQAMKSVFSDLQTELQRSLGFFSNLDRAAKIGRVVAMGNAFKLPGLRRYLSQGLGYDIERVEAYRGLEGPEVLATPAFKDNILSFGVSYGLALQALGRAGLRTNLLPREIVRDRLIREKKPWAVAAAAVVLLACSIDYTAYSMQLGTVAKSRWSTFEAAADGVVGKSNRLKTEADGALAAYRKTEEIGTHLVSNVAGRTRWLTLLQAVNTCLPKEDDPKKPPAEIPKRKQVLVTNIDSQQVADVGAWFSRVKKDYTPMAPADQAAVPAAPAPGVPGAPAAPMPGAPVSPGAPGAANPGMEGEAGPSGPGYIVQISGRHYHNNVSGSGGGSGAEGAQYIRNTLLKKLADKSMQDLGISYPVLIDPGTIKDEIIEAPRPAGRSNEGGPVMTIGHGAIGPGPGAIRNKADASADDQEQGRLFLRYFDFRIQFVWKPGGPAGPASNTPNPNPGSPRP